MGQRTSELLLVCFLFPVFFVGGGCLLEWWVRLVVFFIYIYIYSADAWCSHFLFCLAVAVTFIFLSGYCVHCVYFVLLWFVICRIPSLPNW